MAKKSKASSRSTMNGLGNLSHWQLGVSALVFAALVGVVGTYFINSSFAFTPCNKQGTQGYGNDNACVSVLQRVVRNYGLAQPSSGDYFHYQGRSVLVPSNFVDENFGLNTQAQVKNYQRWNGLTADGLVGPKTWANMCQQPFVYISRSDRLLACGY